MKNFKYTLLLFSILSSYATSFGQKMVSKDGQVSFFSETPMENIAAVNNNVTCVIDASNGNVAVKMQMVEFKFKNKLMEEHFNENYMESEKYPNGYFSGTIADKFDITKDGSYPVTAQGKLAMHGAAKEVTLKGILTVKNGKVNLKTDFKAKPGDFNIKIPSLVMVKIAEEIEVKCNITFQ
jgi:polyisoprenoid-binding protein YceI